MNPKKRRILSLSGIKKEDQYLKKLLICLKNSLKIFSVILVLSGATADDTGWKAVERNVKISYDLDTTPLQIKTDSPAGSGEILAVYLYSAGGEYVDYASFSINSPPQYYIAYCSAAWTDLPSALPSEVNKIWQLTKLPGPRIILQCNGVTVLDILLSDNTCTHSDWSSSSMWWSRQAKQIMFSSSDTASQEYRASKPVDGGWTEFINWSECTATCGGGTVTRIRTCTNPVPAYGGVDCQGKSTESLDCNTHDCPVDGGWSEFGDLSECFCGGPVQIRTRTCTNPAPDPGGADCKGPRSETQDCYTEDYPEDCSGCPLVC